MKVQLDGRRAGPRLDRGTIKPQFREDIAEAFAGDAAGQRAMAGGDGRKAALLMRQPLEPCEATRRFVPLPAIGRVQPKPQDGFRVVRRDGENLTVTGDGLIGSRGGQVVVRCESDWLDGAGVEPSHLLQRLQRGKMLARKVLLPGKQ